MKTEFEFLDELPPRLPPKVGRPDPLLIKYAQALKEHKGMWSPWPKKIARSSASTYQQLINKRPHVAPQAFQSGGFEARVREGILYVRYVGAK